MGRGGIGLSMKMDAVEKGRVPKYVNRESGKPCLAPLPLSSLSPHRSQTPCARSRLPAAPRPPGQRARPPRARPSQRTAAAPHPTPHPQSPAAWQAESPDSKISAKHLGHILRDAISDSGLPLEIPEAPRVSRVTRLDRLCARLLDPARTGSASSPVASRPAAVTVSVRVLEPSSPSPVSPPARPPVRPLPSPSDRPSGLSPGPSLPPCVKSDRRFLLLPYRALLTPPDPR